MNIGEAGRRVTLPHANSSLGSLVMFSPQQHSDSGTYSGFEASHFSVSNAAIKNL
jgi:hypothetical protein